MGFVKLDNGEVVHTLCLNQNPAIKAELKDMAISINLVKITSEEIKAVRCGAYKYLIK